MGAAACEQVHLDAVSLAVRSFITSADISHRLAHTCT